jgi:uncharacterized protein
MFRRTPFFPLPARHILSPMPQVDKHPPGAFCWIELGTTDQNAAKKFYASVFGWDVKDMPMGPGAAYTIFKLQDRDAAAAYTLRPDQRSMGVPPHWMLYVTVENADVAAKKAQALGGKIMAGPFDAGTFGRMAVIQDPTGAILSLWQAKDSAGLGIAGENGTLCWSDLSTPDQARAAKFYSDLFGWRMTEDTDDDPPSGYLHIQNGDDFIGGISPAKHRDPKTPPHWLAYFQVQDCDSTAAKAKQLSAELYLAPMTMEGVGRIAVIADPQSAVFAIFQAMPRK